MTQDALVSVAAGRSQLPLLEAARERGLAVVAIDRDPDAPGFALASLAIQASTHAADEAEGALREALASPAGQGLRPVAVATKSSGPPVATAAALAAALGLPGLHPGRARALVSKPGQLKAAALADVRVPRHCAPPSLDELPNAGLVPPLVLKPAATRVGKQGIALVRAAADLPRRFEEARAASGDGRCEIEEYLPGRDLVLAALFRDSRLTSTVALDEDTRFLASGALRGYGLGCPSTLAGKPPEASARAAVGRFVEALQLGTGFGLWTFRVRADAADDAEPALLEVHLDLAGDLVTEGLLPRALGCSVLGLCLDHLLGADVAFPEPCRGVDLRFLFEEDRASVDGLDAADWHALESASGPPALEPAGAAGARIGHVRLESQAGRPAAAVRTLDARLGRGVPIAGTSLSGGNRT